MQCQMTIKQAQVDWARMGIPSAEINPVLRPSIYVWQLALTLFLPASSCLALGYNTLLTSKVQKRPQETKKDNRALVSVVLLLPLCNFLRFTPQQCKTNLPRCQHYSGTVQLDATTICFNVIRSLWALDHIRMFKARIKRTCLLGDMTEW